MVWPTGHKVKNGRYVVQEVLGQGGFGITYKAWDTSQNEFVALKTPNEYLKNDPDYQKYVDRFVKESKRLQRLTKLSHPHIVKFGEFFQEGDTYCLVMEFVAGKHFFEIIKERGKLPEKEAVKYTKQIASALAAIHKAGLVHRDAHPGNIILQGDKAILIDFGIAKELVPTTLSSTGDAGNRGFAPYEQMTKGSRERNADVYCLAATLYYLITGQRPTSSFARKMDKANLIPPRKLVLEVSKDLNKAILKGMELEAYSRTQSVEKWLYLLEVQRRRNKKVIPWGWLGFLLIAYVCPGVVFSLASVPYLVWIVAVAGTVAVAVAWAAVAPWNITAMTGAWFIAMVWAWTWAIAIGAAVIVVSGTEAETVLWNMAMAFAVVCAGYMAVEELAKYFSRFHVFLILAITSLLGLGLGGLLGLAYKAIFNS